MAIRVYVNRLDRWALRLRQELETQLRKLVVDPSAIPWLEDDSGTLPRRSVVLFFSNSPDCINADCISELEGHISRGLTVVPVLDNVDDATRKLPECLKDFNAFALHPSSWFERYKDLVDLVLTELWLHRENRKIFVSYRRADSSGIAHQLWESLTCKQYEVFLDDYSLRPGVNVQRELMWWLYDADFILLLVSPHLAHSEWVKEEIAAATHASIGFLALVWPPGSKGQQSEVLPQLMWDQVYKLDCDSFEVGDVQPCRQRLVDYAVQPIIEKIEEFRVRAIQQRLQSLVPHLRANVPQDRFELRDGNQPGDMKLVDRHSGELFYARVLPFRPTLDAIYSLREELRDSTTSPSKVLFFYRENDRHDPRVSAMEWILEPKRHNETPSHYRVLPYVGDTLKLDC